MTDDYNPSREELLEYDDQAHRSNEIGCRYCHAPIGAPCINQVTQKPMHHFTAHLIRIKDAENEVPF